MSRDRDKRKKIRYQLHHFLHRVRRYRPTYRGTSGPSSILLDRQSKISSFFATLSCQFSSCAFTTFFTRSLSPFSAYSMGRSRLIVMVLFRGFRPISLWSFISFIRASCRSSSERFSPEISALCYFIALQKYFDQNAYNSSIKVHTFLIILYNNKIKMIIFNSAIKCNKECRKKHNYLIFARCCM